MPSLKFNPDGSPHIHSYVRRTRTTHRCNHPDCTHFTRSKDLQGKRTLCSICHVNYCILDYEQLRNAKTRCDDCRNTKEAIQKRKIKQILEGSLL